MEKFYGRWNWTTPHIVVQRSSSSETSESRPAGSGLCIRILIVIARRISG